MIKYSFLILSLILFVNNGQANDSLSCSFYGLNFSIHYDAGFTQIDAPKKNSEDALKKTYLSIEKTNYQAMVNNLQKIKKEYQLNDWWYYRLVCKSLDEIIDENEKTKHLIYQWFIMAKSGYNVVLNYKGKSLFLGAFTRERVPKCPYFPLKDGYRIILNLINTKYNVSKLKSYAMKFKPNQAGRPFSLRYEDIPNIYSNYTVTKKITFTHKGETHTPTFTLNKSYLELLSEYPEVSVLKHAQTPLSKQAYHSVVEYFKHATKSMKEKSRVAFILSFCRTGFKYKADGKNDNVSLTAEETLYSEYSDCEDRSILFYRLMKDICNLDALILEYPQHIAAAVAISKPSGKVIEHNGKKYTFCEPTNLDDNMQIGQLGKQTSKYKYKVCTW